MTADESTPGLSDFLSRLMIRVVGTNQFIHPSHPSRWCRVEPVSRNQVRLHLTFDHSFDEATLLFNIKNLSFTLEKFKKGVYRSFYGEVYYDDSLMGTFGAGRFTMQPLNVPKDILYYPIKADFPTKEQHVRYGFTPADNSHVSIIILNYNGIEWTLPLIRSIYEKTSYPYELIILDNVSDEENQKKLVELTKQKLPIQLKVILQSERTGVGRAWNEGIRQSTGKYVLLLNNDMLVIEDYWLLNLVNTAESDSSIGVVGCNLLFPDGKIQHVGGSPIPEGVFHPHYGEPYDHKKYGTIRDCDWVTGAAYMIKRDVIDKVGGFDADSFHSGFEDVDYSLRVKYVLGRRIVCSPVRLIHYESMTDKKLGLKKDAPDIFKRKWKWLLGGYPAWK